MAGFMKSLPLTWIAAAALALAGCATPLGQSRGATTYANPVLDADFPDPRHQGARRFITLCHSDPIGDSGHIQLARSSDMGQEQLGDAPRQPAGRQDPGVWAPTAAARDTIIVYSGQARGAYKHSAACAWRSPQPVVPKAVLNGQPLQCGETLVNIDRWNMSIGNASPCLRGGFRAIKVGLAPDGVSRARQRTHRLIQCEERPQKSANDRKAPG